MTRSRFVAFVTAAALAVPGIAMAAAWSVGTAANSTGAAAATNLQAAASVDSPTQTSSSITVRVVTAPASGGTPTSYRVDETSPAAASGVCTITGSTGSCTANSLTNSTSYQFAIFSKIGTNWVSASSASLTVSTKSLGPLTFTGASTACTNGTTLHLGSGSKNWTSKVSIPNAVAGNVAIAVADTHTTPVSTTVNVIAGNTQSSTGGNSSPPNNGEVKFTLASGDTSITVTASATNYDSVSCTLAH